ncbi:MAG TPA: zinc ABC transporter substrate-binding protein [Candidatus Kapabacteria bacterium]|nr:zinc ABC transporter substrate-binding protein [Candidatus Kapabacteria bacterium]
MRQKSILKKLSPIILCGILLMGCGKQEPARRAGGKLAIVAAENFYGSVASEIAGDSANVISILINPNQNPHEFTTDAATAKSVADADIVIYNGMGYDNWMQKLLGANGNPSRIAICVSDLIGAKAGDDPHIWYDPRTMPALAARLADILKRPERIAHFANEMGSVTAKISEIKSKYNGTPVTATEPVFDYMARALGFKMENEGFQHAVMNGTEPSAEQTANFEKSLREKTVRILFYNSQVTSPATERMVAIAKASGVPVAGVTEMQPPGAKNYTDWMLAQLNKIETALDATH